MHHFRFGVVVATCVATAFVLGCPSKKNDPPGTVVAAPSSAPTPLPRVKVEIFAVRKSDSTGAISIQVATALTYTPKKCDPAKYLVPAPTGSASARRRMTLFRVKDVSLTAPGSTLIANQGGETPADIWPEQGGERAVVIDCVDDVPAATPLTFVFQFAAPEGFDPKKASFVLEGQSLPLADKAMGQE